MDTVLLVLVFLCSGISALFSWLSYAEEKRTERCRREWKDKRGRVRALRQMKTPTQMKE